MITMTKTQWWIIIILLVICCIFSWIAAFKHNEKIGGFAFWGKYWEYTATEWLKSINENIDFIKIKLVNND